MDFIEKLPKSKGKDTIWVIIDRLSKYAHFIPLAHPFTASGLAQLFLDNIYKLHGAPANIISDRDPLFTSQFWREFLLRLGVQQHMSKAYHPQSDGQREVLNRCLEHYLRCFSWQQPHEWAQWLSLAERWYNTTYHSSTKMTPFEVMYGQPPPLHLPYLPQESAIESIDRSFSARETLLLQLKENLAVAINRMKQLADKHRSERHYQVGDWVFLKLQPHRQTSVAPRSYEKLSPRYYGPFHVAAKVGEVAYTLELPGSSRIHPTFHVSQLKRSPNSSVPILSLPDSMNGVASLREPYAILDLRVVPKYNRAVTQVLIHWSSELPEESMWEDWTEFSQRFPSFVSAINP
ncbi:hypothetical protein QN277_023237 [Acacia crassicarpa]|uniref:Integrase catalytic domain-containing protein n=1 Tax=Acacia crassicarpa TaxID=499986 RepID=A0AAE1MQG7_9FABA|nr:hypothetical protein QN277_023237 [Acacia crassicarpa]